MAMLEDFTKFWRSPRVRKSLLKRSQPLVEYLVFSGKNLMRSTITAALLEGFLDLSGRLMTWEAGRGLCAGFNVSQQLYGPL